MVALQDVQAALGKLGLDSANLPMHVSDSASSVTSAANSLLVGISGKGIASMAVAAAAAAAAAAGNSGVQQSIQQSMSGPGSSARSNGSPAGGLYSMPPAVGLDRQIHAQQMMIQSGLSPADAVSMLMTLGLGGGSDPYAGAGAPYNSGVGGGMYGGMGSHGNIQQPNILMAELLEMQARQQQQQQQQLVAAVHAQAQAQQLVAGLQAQQAFQAAVGSLGGGGVVGGPGAAPASHMAAAQQLLQQAAQMNISGMQHAQGMAGVGAAGGSYGIQNQAMANAAAAQLLQQAGFAGVPGAAAAYGPPGGMMMGHGFGGLGGYGAALTVGGSGPGYMGIHTQPHSHMASGGRGGMDPSHRPGNGGGGGRLSRRSADPAAEAERKAQQEKLYAMDAERILSGQDRRTT